jgi:phospholipid/cholesterol/gamma-HCH transport system substrate-binding protein
MRSAIRKHLRDFVAIVALALIAGFTGLYVLAHQRASLPEWVPLFGQDFFELKGEFSTAQAITPGQGQTVNIAGVAVGEISRVELVDGRAIVTMRLEPRYDDVYPDATMLLRPKTGLKDMVVELNPGSRAAGARVDEGYLVRVSNTQPDVNLDEILAVLDGDTRAYLQLLLNGAATGLTGQGRDLAQVWRRFAPTARDGAKLTKLLAERRRHIRRAVHNFATFTHALGDRDEQLARFVGSSNDVFRRFANQDANLQRTIALLPEALAETQDALAKAKEFADNAGPALAGLTPGARALAPSLRATRPFLRETTPIIRDQIRPFTRAALPVVRTLRPAAKGLADATPGLTTTFEVLNAFLNALAYNPPGQKEGYLFYLTWLNHISNSIFSAQDAHGPMRRGMLMIECPKLTPLRGIKRRGGAQAGLALLTQLSNIPDVEPRDAPGDCYQALERRVRAG